MRKNKQAKSRGDLNGKRVGSKIGIVSLSGIQNLNAWVAVDAYLVSKVFKVLDFMPDLKVGQFIDLTTLLFHQQRL